MVGEGVVGGELKQTRAVAGRKEQCGTSSRHGHSQGQIATSQHNAVSKQLRVCSASARKTAKTHPVVSGKSLSLAEVLASPRLVKLSVLHGPRTRKYTRRKEQDRPRTRKSTHPMLPKNEDIAYEGL